MNLTLSTNASFALPPALRTVLVCILAICLADLILSIRRLLRQPFTMQTLFQPAILILIHELRFHAQLARSIRRPDDAQ